MGLLDDLKKQADALKAQDTDRTESLRANAVAVDLALRRNFLYLNDLGKQLNVVQMPCPFTLQDPHGARHRRAHRQGLPLRLPLEALHRQGLLRRGAHRLPRLVGQGPHREEGPGRDGEVPRLPLVQQHRAQERAVPRPAQGDHARDLQDRVRLPRAGQDRGRPRERQDQDRHQERGGLRGRPLQPPRAGVHRQGGRGVRQVLHRPAQRCGRTW